MNVDVYIWGTKIGTVVQKELNHTPQFMYEPSFLRSGIELSPITMPLSNQVYSFPSLPQKTFHGLPGLLADALPDKFGNRIIADFLAKQGKTEENLSAVERLCYVGNRGMGALEFVPHRGVPSTDKSIDIDELADLADRILSDRKNIKIHADEHAMQQLIEVGTSAGGARAKAIIAWNEEKQDIRSGQINAGDGYSYWLLKFGTIENNKDKDEKADQSDYSKIEYAYSLMAKDAGINMTECRLLETKEGCHFATKRFDREDGTGKKIHMQSLGAIAHFDFNEPGAHSYEQSVAIMRQLKLSQAEVEQFFRRMVFNEVTVNYDDHVKNTSFLMDRKGKWSLSPAYDLTFSYKKDSQWVSKHQMRINGKMDDIRVKDMIDCGRTMDISNKKITDTLEQVIKVVQNWSKYAEEAKIKEQHMAEIKKNFRYTVK